MNDSEQPVRHSLQQRRLALQQQSALLRERLQQHTHQLQPVLQSMDKGWSGAVWLREHPWVLGVVVAWLTWRRPRRAWTWAKRGWTAWRWLGRARQLWSARALWLASVFSR